MQHYSLPLVDHRIIRPEPNTFQAFGDVARRIVEKAKRGEPIK